MTTTRERALNAALELVGEQGIRALVHARVDERAGLPKGSTSNWFRTRDALVAGVVGWIAERERDDFYAGAAPTVTTPDQLIDAFSSLISAETSLFAGRTRARYALFLEGANDPQLLEPLLQQRAAYVEWAIALLAGVGAARPADAVRALMAAAEGLVMHRLTVDPDAPVRPVVERIVRACLD
ncbi:TetR/AcrR family transcriptional regulator [Arthrobacter burdickii]|uniref:TetR family transcriptional regulator n=1 Tax=Arthrobacter burdickii TaxID=3035920 RepID=A0ABT8JWG7_9MICC|nr:TetR family transcriptional regulator [Arthrobacter burdickii]MDN4609519.1 TetR family transcriptional regulator [Arthrobacter burdickii]